MYVNETQVLHILSCIKKHYSWLLSVTDVELLAYLVSIFCHGIFVRVAVIQSDELRVIAGDPGYPPFISYHRCIGFSNLCSGVGTQMHSDKFFLFSFKTQMVNLWQIKWY